MVQRSEVCQTSAKVLEDGASFLGSLMVKAALRLGGNRMLNNSRCAALALINANIGAAPASTLCKYGIGVTSAKCTFAVLTQHRSPKHVRSPDHGRCPKWCPLVVTMCAALHLQQV